MTTEPKLDSETSTPTNHPAKVLAYGLACVLAGAAVDRTLFAPEPAQDCVSQTPLVLAPPTLETSSESLSEPEENLIEVGVITIQGEPDPIPSVRPRSYVDALSANGDWIDAGGLPLPELTVESGRRGSKTPHNLRIRSEVGLIGCGFYDSGAAFCKEQRVGSRKVRDVKATVHFRRDEDRKLTVHTTAYSDSGAIEPWFEHRFVRKDDR
jgi:hypothetical protein